MESASAVLQQNPFIQTIVSSDPTVNNRDFFGICESLSASQLLTALKQLEDFRRHTDNLYHQVRACLFLYAGYRFFLEEESEIHPTTGTVPVDGYTHLLERRFESAINTFKKALDSPMTPHSSVRFKLAVDEKSEVAEEGEGNVGPNGNLCSALAEVYHELAFDKLSEQVRQSVRTSPGNEWMFKVNDPKAHPYRIHPDLLKRATLPASSSSSFSSGEEPPQLYPVLRECTPVRMDLTHSCWSDIFFLAMDYPEAARVINISVDLGVYNGKTTEVKAPIEAYLRVIPKPVIRLSSLDLTTTKEISELSDLFNFGNDYLGLLKAGVIVSGMIPPSFEECQDKVTLQQILEHVVGKDLGIELVTNVNNIPRGSRLAVSTNLLAGIITVFMRATGQTQNLTGVISDAERRLVASRAILGEWLGGSGGGWQDSGGIWPGIKEITGKNATEADPEYGISKGALLPGHTILDGSTNVHDQTAERICQSIVLLHGGMAQDVGPILEMVTEKYLLRSFKEYEARKISQKMYDQIKECLCNGDVKGLAKLTTEHWNGPLKTIIPWVTNEFTERIIARATEKFGENFWGFLMLGGMSGGGMAMFCEPSIKEEFKRAILEIMISTKRELETSLPFAIDPQVYDFEINYNGTLSAILPAEGPFLPDRYYYQQQELAEHAGEMFALDNLRKFEFGEFFARKGQAAEERSEKEAEERKQKEKQKNHDEEAEHTEKELPSNNKDNKDAKETEEEASRRLMEEGFDPIQHEQFREQLKVGKIGLASNRLPLSTKIEDVMDDEVMIYYEAQNAKLASEEEVRKRKEDNEKAEAVGKEHIKKGGVAVLTLAAGVGSRWTQGAAVIKALNPFLLLQGKHRNFLELQIAKTRKTANQYGVKIPHVVTTGFLTHGPIEKYVDELKESHKKLMEEKKVESPLPPIYLSQGTTVHQRLIPTVRDLQFLWEELNQEKLPEMKQKVRDMQRNALIGWAKEKGEASDYFDNLAVQRFNPPGHWYEVPNLLKNGALGQVLKDFPSVTTLMLHNIDTLGVSVDPVALGYHLRSGNVLTFEVVPRRINDKGGGLAKVNGHIRLLEGLAQPHEENELKLRHYNSMTTWIQIDELLKYFGLTRADVTNNLENEAKILAAIRQVAEKLPTYVTIKEVKKRWGYGYEDVYPITQLEKLWSDMTALKDLQCGFLVVSRVRGKQLKDKHELDSWANDGSKDYVESLCEL